MSKKSDVSWTKAEKAYPKKTATVVSFLNANSAKTNNEDSKKMNKTSENAVTRPTFKDLCDEDKIRMANLIKELARIAEEKKVAEQQLEEEKRQRETQLREVLKRQESLVEEKERLEAKFNKTHLKLAELKSKLKQEKSLVKNVESSKVAKHSQQHITHSNEEKSPKERAIDIFSSNKSSTPNISPRSISPIAPILPTPVFSNTNECNSDCFIDPNSKRIDLVHQRIQLMSEQKSLWALLEQQEKILKEKQEEILLQQRLHRERLEELARIKLENERNAFNIQQQQQQQQISIEKPKIQENEIQIENQDQKLNEIVSLVYHKLLQNKPNDSKEEQKTKIKNDEMFRTEENPDDDLIDLVKNEKILAKNKRRNEKNGSSNSDCCSVGDEESKLIDDLFFIK